jgi:hypothetical protein
MLTQDFIIKQYRRFIADKAVIAKGTNPHSFVPNFIFRIVFLNIREALPTGISMFWHRV